MRAHLIGHIRVACVARRAMCMSCDRCPSPGPCGCGCHQRRNQQCITQGKPHACHVSMRSWLLQASLLLHHTLALPLHLASSFILSSIVHYVSSVLFPPPSHAASSSIPCCFLLHTMLLPPPCHAVPSSMPCCSLLHTMLFPPTCHAVSSSVPACCALLHASMLFPPSCHAVPSSSMPLCCSFLPY